MSGINFQRALSATLCVAMAAVPLAAQAETTIRCESDSYRYRYCPIRTDNRVDLIHQLSKTGCRQNRTWGYDRGGVWVDQGCAAEFRVGGGGSGLSHGEKTAIGAIAGLAIIGAIANSKNSQAQQQDVSSWAVGNFSGYDSYEGTNVQVNILPGGSLNGYAGNNSFSGYVRGNRMEAGRHVFNISRQGNGFQAVDDRDASHRVYFQRNGGGY